MKQIQNRQNVIPYMRTMCMGILCIALSIPGYAQTAEAGDQEVAPKKIEKAVLRMSLEAFTVNDSIRLVARVRSKVGSKFQNTAGVEVSFYSDEINPDMLIGKAMSNPKGEAVLMLSTGNITDCSTGATYLSAVNDHPSFKDVDEEVLVNCSKMKMKLVNEDTVRWVKVFVGSVDSSGQEIPVPDAECKIFIKRMFGLLQVGDPQVTDEEGNISLEFPNDIQGDPEGNIKLIAKISDHDLLGNVEINQTITWGIPTKVDDFYLQKELWSARANSPLLLIIIVNTVLVGIWGLILFIFIEIFRINKLGRAG